MVKRLPLIRASDINPRWRSLRAPDTDDIPELSLEDVGGVDITEAEAAELAVDFLPTIDEADREAPPRVTYRDWDPASTRIVIYTTDADAFPKDRYMPGRMAAQAHCEGLHGRILEANYVGPRCFFRVRR